MTGLANYFMKSHELVMKAVLESLHSLDLIWIEKFVIYFFYVSALYFFTLQQT